MTDDGSYAVLYQFRQFRQKVYETMNFTLFGYQILAKNFFIYSEKCLGVVKT